MSSLRVLPADLDDPVHARGIVDLLDSYAGGPGGGGRPLSDETRRALVPELRRVGNALAWLAFDDRRPIGLALCFVGFSTFAARPLVNVHDLAVLPEFQGRGVGRRLLAAVEERARALGCCKLTLEVIEDNERARGLYGRFGFGPGEGAPRTLFLEKPLP